MRQSLLWGYRMLACLAESWYTDARRLRLSDLAKGTRASVRQILECKGYNFFSASLVFQSEWYLSGQPVFRLDKLQGYGFCTPSERCKL